MAWRMPRFSSICSPIAMAIRSLMPLISDSRSGSSSITLKVSALKWRTILEAKAAPTPLMAPEPKYRSTVDKSSGAFISYSSTWSCSP